MESHLPKRDQVSSYSITHFTLTTNEPHYTSIYILAPISLCSLYRTLQFIDSNIKRPTSNYTSSSPATINLSIYLSTLFPKPLTEMSIQPTRSRYDYPQEDPENERAVTAPPRAASGGNYPPSDIEYTPYVFDAGAATETKVKIRRRDACSECKLRHNNCTITGDEKFCDPCKRGGYVCTFELPSQAKEELDLLLQGERKEVPVRCIPCSLRNTRCFKTGGADRCDICINQNRQCKWRNTS